MAVKRRTVEETLPAAAGGLPVRKKMPVQRVMTDESEIGNVTKVIKSGFMTALTNPVVEEFEREFAKYIGTKYAVAVNSGTAALHVALAALDVGPGDEVIVPPYTFIATASAVLQQNAVPVFADIDPKTLNIDPKEIEKKITGRTKAIIPVHLFGLPAEMRAVRKLAKKHGIAVIEDACQSHGAIYHGNKVGTFGDMACFSFQESKNMMTGEGGIVVTNNKKLADKCRVIKHIGMAAKYVYVALGYNYRMTAMAAAVGLAQLRKLDGFNAHRRRMADYYRKNLADVPVGLIEEPEGLKSANHIFPVVLPGRIAADREKTAEIYKALAAENVPIWWVYPMPIYNVEFFRERKAYTRGCPFECPHREKPYVYKNNECPVAEDISSRTLVLVTAPCYGLSVAADTVKALKKVIRYYDK